jgi:hypothetical protein
MIEVDGMEGCHLPHSGIDSAITPEQFTVTVFDLEYFNIYVQYSEYLRTPGALWEEIRTYSGLVKSGPQQNKLIMQLNTSEQNHLLTLINILGCDILAVF